MTNTTFIADLAGFEWGPLTAALAGGCVILVVLTLAHRVGSRERRRQFASRLPVSEDEWFQCYYLLAIEERSIVMPVLQELGRLLGIHWTQLRPEDRFSGNLRLKWRFFNADQDELDDMSEWIVSWARRNGVPLNSLPRWEDELGRFLDQLREAYTRRTERRLA